MKRFPVRRWLLALLWLSNAAFGKVPSEYELKAVLVSKLVGFVDWPVDAEVRSRPFCIVGRDPFEGLLDDVLAGTANFGSAVRTDDGRIERFDDASADLQRCGAVFLSNLDQADTDRVIDQLGNAPVLTISDQPRFAERGGMIHLELINRRVRFRINQQACETRGLTVSYKLLRLAEIVGPGSLER